MTKRRGLGGLGIDVLLSAASGAKAVQQQAGRDGDLKLLPIESLRRGKYQPRGVIQSEDLETLAASIRAHGVVQPVVVRVLEGGTYELIAGERRWRAAQLAGLTEVPALIRKADDAAAAAMALIENIQRRDLNPLEEAAAFRRLIEEFGLTHQETADAVGRSRAAVSNLLRLLDLHPDVQALVNAGELEMGHARAVLALQGEAQLRAAQQVADQQLSVRETERLVQRLSEAKDEVGRRAAVTPDPDIASLERRMEDRLGTRVQLKQDGKGRGRLTIHYLSLDQLQGLLEQLGVAERTDADL